MPIFLNYILYMIQSRSINHQVFLLNKHRYLGSTKIVCTTNYYIVWNRNENFESRSDKVDFCIQNNFDTSLFTLYPIKKPYSAYGITWPTSQYLYKLRGDVGMSKRPQLFWEYRVDTVKHLYKNQPSHQTSSPVHHYQRPTRFLIYSQLIKQSISSPPLSIMIDYLSPLRYGGESIN